MGPNSIDSSLFVREDPDTTPQLTSDMFTRYDPDDLQRADSASLFTRYDPDETPAKKYQSVNTVSDEEFKNMNFIQKMMYANKIEEEAKYRMTKGITKGTASSISLGQSEKIDALAPAEDDLLFGLGEMIGTIPLIEIGVPAATAAIKGVIGKPLISLMAKSPYTKNAVEALTRMTAFGLTGAAIESGKQAIKTDEVPTIQDVIEHGNDWALMDAAFQVVGKGGSLVSKLFRAPNRLKTLNNVVTQLGKEKINPEVSPQEYVSRAEELLDQQLPKEKTPPASTEKNILNQVVETAKPPEALSAQPIESGEITTEPAKFEVGNQKQPSNEFKNNVSPEQEIRPENQQQTFNLRQKKVAKPKTEQQKLNQKVQETPKAEKIPEPIIETTGKGAAEQIHYEPTQTQKIQETISNVIEAAKTPAETFKKSASQVNTAIFNFLAPLEKMEEGLPIHEKVSTKIKLAQSAASEINSTLENGVFSNMTGQFEHEGLKGAYGDLAWQKITKGLKPHEYNVKELNIYRDAKESLRRQNLGQETGVDTLKAKKEVAEFQEKYGPIAKRIQKYNRAVLETYGKDMLGQKKIDSFDKDFYTSLYRLMDTGKDSILPNGSLQPKQWMKRAVGSKRMHLPPSESDIYNTAMLIRTARKNDSVIQYMKGVQNGKLEGKIRPSKNNPVPISVLNEAGIPIAQLEVAENVFNQTRKNSFTPEENILKCWVDGHPIEIEVPSEVYEIFSTYAPQDYGPLTKLFQFTNKMLSKGITMEPISFAKIAARDALQSLIYSKTGSNPISVFEALSHIYKNSEVYQQFKALGGDVYAARLATRTERAKKLEDLITPGTKGIMVPIEKVGKFFSKYSEALGDISTAVPLAEYERAIKKFGNTPEGRIAAIIEAKRVTYDPARHGSSKKVRFANTVTPFLNVGLQDLSKAMQGLTEKSTNVKGMLALSLPAIMMKFINEGNPDYDNLTPGDKAAFFHIFYGKNHLRIMIPWITGTIYKVGAEFFYDMVKNQAEEGNERAKEAWQGLHESFTENVSGAMPPIMSAYIEQTTGKSPQSPLGVLFGTESRAPPVVPKRLENLPNELQYTSKTSQLAKWFGKHWGVSPVKMERLVNSFGGNISKDMFALIDEAAYFSGLAEDKRPEQNEKNYLLLGKILSDATPTRTKQQQKFYEYLDEATKNANATKLILTKGINDVDLEQYQSHGVPLFKYNNAISAFMKLMRSTEESSTLTPKVKKERLEGYQKEINRLYKKAVDEVDASKRKSKK